MNKMNHKKKVKLARSMMSRAEKRGRTPLFWSKQWMTRKLENHYKQLKIQGYQDNFLSSMVPKTK